MVVKLLIERFSIECRKTKAKVITLANHKGHKHYSEPIKTRSNYTQLTQSTTGSRGVPFERMNKKTTYLFEMHCCVNSPGQKSSFPSQYTFIFAGPLLPNRFLTCEPPLFLNLLTADCPADYCEHLRKAKLSLRKAKLSERGTKCRAIKLI